jgi:hypothetical protein
VCIENKLVIVRSLVTGKKERRTSRKEENTLISHLFLFDDFVNNANELLRFCVPWNLFWWQRRKFSHSTNKKSPNTKMMRRRSFAYLGVHAPLGIPFSRG